MPKLLKLSNKAREIGSSAPLIASCHEIRQRFTVILFLFQQTKPFFDLDDKQRKQVPPVAKSAAGNVHLKNFPKHLLALAKSIIAFLDTLNYFPKIMNKDVRLTLSSLNLFMLAYHGDLIVSCL